MLFERHADRLELGMDAGCVDADADAEDDPALADLVERGDLVGKNHRVAQRRHEDGRSELDTRRPRGDGAQQRHRLVAGPRGDRIADPDRVEAEIFRLLRQRQ